MNLDVLAIGAHPDDIEIFAGGTLARIVRIGGRIGLLHLSRGEAGTRGTPQIRLEEARAAASVLGADFVRVLEIPDGQIQDIPPHREPIVHAIRETRPKLLLAPWIEDDHPDHAATGQLAKACWYLSGIRNAHPGEHPPHRPGQLWFYPSHEPLDATCLVPLEQSDVDRKIASIQAYRSQFDPNYPGAPQTRISTPEFHESLVARLRTYGAQIQTTFAEAFRGMHPHRISDPRLSL